jgi:hypothetical protein
MKMKKKTEEEVNRFAKEEVSLKPFDVLIGFRTLLY